MNEKKNKNSSVSSEKGNDTHLNVSNKKLLWVSTIFDPYQLFWHPNCHSLTLALTLLELSEQRQSVLYLYWDHLKSIQYKTLVYSIYYHPHIVCVYFALSNFPLKKHRKHFESHCHCRAWDAQKRLRPGRLRLPGCATEPLLLPSLVGGWVYHGIPQPVGVLWCVMAVYRIIRTHIYIEFL